MKKKEEVQSKKRKVVELSSYGLPEPAEYLNVFDEIEGVYSVDEALSYEDIQKLMKKALESNKFEIMATKQKTKRRKNASALQMEFSDEGLADRLFRKLEKEIVELVGGQTSAKFVPVGIDEHWKILKYEEGSSFDKTIVDQTSTAEESSFVTVHVYLSDETDGLEGGETTFYNHSEKLTIKPLKGRTVCFLHKVALEGEKVEQGTKMVLQSVVLFKPITNEKTVEMDECETRPVFGEDEITLEVGGEQFIISTGDLVKHPKCMISTMVTSSLTDGITTDEDGRKQFDFPSQDAQIFKSFIIPLLKNQPLPFVNSQIVKDKVDSEIKFWGFNSPFDPEFTMTTHLNWRSAQFQTISKVMKAEIDSTMEKYSNYAKVLNCTENVKTKCKSRMTLKGNINDLNNVFQSRNKKNQDPGPKIFTYEFSSWFCEKLAEQMAKQHEYIALSRFYNGGKELHGSDLHLYELCCDFFGKEAVSIKPLSFYTETRPIESNQFCKPESICNAEVQSVTRSLLEAANDSGYGLCMRDDFRQKIHELNTVEEMEEFFEASFVKMTLSEIESKGTLAMEWESEGDESAYCTRYIVYDLSCIHIDVSLLK